MSNSVNLGWFGVLQNQIATKKKKNFVFVFVSNRAFLIVTICSNFPFLVVSRFSSFPF